MFSKLVAAFLLPVLAAAQDYGAPAPTPTTTAPQVVPSAPLTDAPGTMNVGIAGVVYKFNKLTI